MANVVIKICYDLFRLYGNGTRIGTGNRTEGHGSYTEVLSLVRYREMNQDPLFLIVLVQFPVTVPFPCSVNKPLKADEFTMQWLNNTGST